jgi:hypothetical protein
MELAWYGFAGRRFGMMSMMHTGFDFSYTQYFTSLTASKPGKNYL